MHLKVLGTIHKKLAYDVLTVVLFPEPLAEKAEHEQGRV